MAGGEVHRSDLAQITEQDGIIAADGGVLKLMEAGMLPHLAVGDFDTLGEDFYFELKKRGIPTQKLPVEKAVTDTQYAVGEALKKEPEEIVILGALGGSRFDHTLANLGLLEWIDEQGVRGILSHESNRIRLLSGPAQISLSKAEFPYVSIIPVTARVEGITTQGLLYPLHGETLYRGMTRGISNEWAERTAAITIETGKCLIVESRD